MTKEYICNKCNQDFKQKNDYIRHINKKYPCITQEELKNSITEDESLKQLESFFHKIRDLLRDNENITGDKALDVITDFLFLRLLNYQIDTDSQINIISQTYNEKIKIEKEEFDLDEYKKYFRWTELINIVNEIDKDSKNHEKKLLLTNVLQHIIFNGLFKLNDNTKDIYRNRRFYVQKTITLMKLLKEYNKINFEDYDVDIKGKAYELTLQKEGATNKDFSQFFTPRWIDKYMVSHAEVKINEDGSYTKLMDPACGTGGILSEYLSFVKKIAEKKDIILDNNVSEYIYGYEIVDDTLKIAHMNILLKSGIYNKNLKCKDFLEVGCFEYNDSDEKFDGNIIMNPPFALTKNYDLTDKESKEVFHTKTKSGTMLFLMSALNTIKDGKQLIMVSPNGKEIFNKNKEYVNIRKHVIENSNLYKIAILPDGAFKPYTGVQTIILMIKKGGKTKEIQFVKVNKNKDDSFTETKICKVKYDQLKEKNYSWNYKEYHSEEKIKYDGLEYKNIGNVCELQNGKFTTSQMDNNGNYDFYSGEALQPIGKHSEYCFDGNNYIILIRAGGSNGKYGDQIGLGKVFIASGKTAGTSPTIKLEIKNKEEISYKYLYYFLKINKNIIADLAHYTTSLGRIAQEDINNLQIPVPPIEVQNIIVKELDLMYREKERLHASIKDTELLKQIHFDSLLMKCKDTETVKLGDVCDLISGKFSASDSIEDGKYPLYTGIVKNPSGFLNDYCFDNPEYLILIRGGGCPEAREREENSHIGLGKIFYVKNKSAGIGGLCALYFKENIKVKYIYYYLGNKQNDFIKLSNFTTRLGNLQIDSIKNYIVYLPSLKDQEDIIIQMEKHIERVKCQEQEIKLIDKLIKERFEYHLQKCKDTKDKPKEEPEKDLDDNEPIKESKNQKDESDNDDKEEKSKKDNSKKIKVKSKKTKKEVDTVEEIEEKPKKDNSKKITIKSKKTKKDTNTNEEIEDKPKKTSK